MFMTDQYSTPDAAGHSLADLPGESMPVFKPNTIAEIGDTVGVFAACWGGQKSWHRGQIISISFTSNRRGEWIERYKCRVSSDHYQSETKTVTRDRVSLCRHLFKS